jgi:hypothetical protein
MLKKMKSRIGKGSTACLILICLPVITDSRSVRLAQETYQPIYETTTNNLANLGWSIDGQQLVFRDFTLGMAPTELKWVTYAPESKKIDKTVQWPLQPVFSPA